jgi:hypothetical protein
MTAQIAQPSGPRCGLAVDGESAGIDDRGAGQGGGEFGRIGRWRGERMEVPERQRELQEQRQQRQSRAAFDVRTEPLHVEIRLASGGSCAGPDVTL